MIQLHHNININDSYHIFSCLFLWMRGNLSLNKYQHEIMRFIQKFSKGTIERVASVWRKLRSLIWIYRDGGLCPLKLQEIVFNIFWANFEGEYDLNLIFMRRKALASDLVREGSNFRLFLRIKHHKKANSTSKIDSISRENQEFLILNTAGRRKLRNSRYLKPDGPLPFFLKLLNLKYFLLKALSHE